MTMKLLVFVVLAIVPLARSTHFTPPNRFNDPASEALDHVNLLIGNGGDTPNGSGGMIPSTAPPYAMTRWVAQTQVNYVSATPYNVSHTHIHGFQATRQPAIWMGESGSVAIVPGVGSPVVDFDKRGLAVRTDGKERREVITPSYYNVELDDGKGGSILAEQSATSRVGHLRFTFSGESSEPFIVIEATRPSIITSTPSNVTYPTGSLHIEPQLNHSYLEICGSSNERQDSIITPISGRTAADTFQAFFCARIQRTDGVQININNVNITQNTTSSGISSSTAANFYGSLLSATVHFPRKAGNQQLVVEARIGTSFISIDQARENINKEIPDGEYSLETTAKQVRAAWAQYVDRIQVQGASQVQKSILFTAAVRSLQYPSEQDESGRYFSAYDGQVHAVESDTTHVSEPGGSYTGYSIWDTYRTQWAWQILFAPERVPGMIRSMLADYKQSGYLPMWKNIAETNIMVGTHADSLIAEAVRKGIRGFDLKLAWEAVWKDATVPPAGDDHVSYDDREENVDYEVRAGLSSVYNNPEKGWVADDIHSESASRTLDYAYDDYAAFVLAELTNQPPETVSFLKNRAMSAPWTLWNADTGFMEARNADGSWAGEDNGWTEGDKWAYSFDVVHNVPELISHRGGNSSFVQSLEDHFEGGHNDHSNEPSHHIPYLYALSGAAFKTQERVREIARENYDDSPTGLSGNEDCGQMSAWYFFSAMGFYPVNPVSGEYIIGSPFFEKLTIQLTRSSFDGDDDGRINRTLTISAPGAQTKPYIKSLHIDGVSVDEPIITHEQIAHGAHLVFEMSEKVERWGNDGDVLKNVWGIVLETNIDNETKKEESVGKKRTERIVPDHVEL